MANTAAAEVAIRIPYESISWEQLRDAALRAFKTSALGHHHTHNTWLVLEAVLRLAWWHARESEGHACYSVPSEAWLGSWLNLARETVSDSIRRLEDHGLLLVTRRRPIGRKFQTNLYRISGRVAAYLVSLVARRRAARGAPNPLPQQRRLSVTSLSHARGRAGLGELYDRWMRRGAAAETEEHG